MNSDYLTQSQIADRLGTNPMRVHRFIKENHVNFVKKDGKRRLYDVKNFNTLEKSLKADSGATSKDVKSKKKILTSHDVKNNVNNKVNTTPKSYSNKALIDSLNARIEDKDVEIAYLKNRLHEKDQIISDKDTIIQDKTDKINDLAEKFATLADQAQHLHLADQKHLMNADKNVQRLVSAFESSTQPTKSKEPENPATAKTEPSTNRQKSTLTINKHEKHWWQFWR